jgi:hypothetical protein
MANVQLTEKQFAERIAEERRFFEGIKLNRRDASIWLLIAGGIYGATLGIFFSGNESWFARWGLLVIVWILSAVFNFLATYQCEDPGCGAYAAGIIFGPLYTIGILYNRLITGLPVSYDRGGDGILVNHLLNLYPDPGVALEAWDKAWPPQAEQPTEPEA